MEAVKQTMNKVKSCKCEKVKQADGSQTCATCSGPNATTCNCKTNKCKCRGCPNASKRVKEGKDVSSSSESSSDEEERAKKVRAQQQPVVAPGGTTGTAPVAPVTRV